MVKKSSTNSTKKESIATREYDPVKITVKPPGKKGLNLDYISSMWLRLLHVLWVPIVVGIVLYYLFGP